MSESVDQHGELQDQLCAAAGNTLYNHLDS